ncbi:MAG: DUF2059 domain-containing protein [Caenibius sp.]
MNRVLGLAAASLISLGFATYSAQAEEPAGDKDASGIATAMEEAFAAEPLSPEAETRLPIASEVAGKIMPDGTYARMMEATLQRMMKPLVAILPQTMPAVEVAAALGVELSVIEEMGEKHSAEIATMLDPHFAERSKLLMNHMMTRMGAIMADMEPDLRQGLTRAYASRFSQQELDDIAGFFATPSGARYATESMLIFTDPQTMSAAMKGMPKMMAAIPEVIAEMGEAASGLPPQRNYDSLTDAERARIAKLLGISTDALREKMLEAESAHNDTAEYDEGGSGQPAD